MAQPIIGMRGDSYHEVLLRMVGEQGSWLRRIIFLPAAHEFGPASRIDNWVIDNTLAFMNDNRHTLPGMRLAINLSPVFGQPQPFPGRSRGNAASL